MIVVMKPRAAGVQIAKVTAYIEQAGYRVHISESEGQVLIGVIGINGLGMLVWQGALAFDLWTDMDLGVDKIAAPMRAACERALASFTLRPKGD